ncbi:MAG TPA: DUF2283 domain-containing protein [Candidatus Xenobia bacterium]|jgi:uncharacterized protein YuzE
MWKTEHIQEGDIYFIQVREGEVAKTLERKPDILVDLDAQGKVLAIEVVGSSTTPVGALMSVLNEFGLVEHASAA